MIHTPTAQPAATCLSPVTVDFVSCLIAPCSKSPQAENWLTLLTTETQPWRQRAASLNTLQSPPRRADLTTGGERKLVGTTQQLPRAQLQPREPSSHVQSKSQDFKSHSKEYIEGEKIRTGIQSATSDFICIPAFMYLFIQYTLCNKSISIYWRTK